MSLGKPISALVLAACVCIAWADAPGVTIANAWVRSTVPGQEVAGAYMEITSTKDARLIKAETPVAKLVEIHSMKMEGGVMRMQAMEALPLPANEAVKLTPGGYHLMLVGIKQQLKPGDPVSVTLTMEDTAKKTSVVIVHAMVREGN